MPGVVPEFWGPYGEGLGRFRLRHTFKHTAEHLPAEPLG